MLQLMILPSVLLLSVMISCNQSGLTDMSEVTEEWEELRRLDGQIQLRRGRQRKMQLKLSRLFEHSMKFSQQNLTIDELQLLPSISLPYKDNMHYAMMLRRSHNFYTLRGDLLFSQTQNPTLVSSIRNQHTYFAEFLPNGTAKICKIKIASKKTSAEVQLFIDLARYAGVGFDWFIAAHHSTNKHYVLASRSARLVLVMQKNGSLVKSISTNSSILSVKKVSSNIVILAQDELFFFNINKNISKTTCLMPYRPIQTFDFDQANLKYIYGQQEDTIYQFQLTSQCRPIKQFHILANSSFFLAGQLLFLSTSELNYAINTTNSRSTPFSFPFAGCRGPSKIAMNRKIQSNYIVTQICLGDSHLNMTHVLLELQDTLSEVTDFSKFRIPLLFLSFGIIIYVTVKNKSKDKADTNSEAQEKEIQEDILKKIANMKQKPQQPPPKPLSTPQSMPQRRPKKQ